jgi:hypothetical protein
MAAQRVQELLHDQNSEQTREQRVGDDRRQAQLSQPPAGRMRTEDRPQRRCHQVAADHPADHQVKAGQPPPIPRLERDDVGEGDAAVLARLGPGGDLLDGGGHRGAAGLRIQEAVGPPVHVDQQCGADRAALQLPLRRGGAGGDAGVAHMAGAGVDLGHHAGGHRLGGHHRDRDVVRVRVVERGHVAEDEPELQKQHTDQQR